MALFICSEETKELEPTSPSTSTYDVSTNAIGNVNSDMLVLMYSVKAAVIRQTDGIQAIFYGGSNSSVKLPWLYKFDPLTRQHTEHMQVFGNSGPYCIVSSTSGTDLFTMDKTTLYKLDVNTKVATILSVYTGKALDSQFSTSCAMTSDNLFYVIDGANKVVYSFDTANAATDGVWYKSAEIPSHHFSALSSALVHDNVIISSYGYTDYIPIGASGLLLQDVEGSPLLSLGE